jgi:hypothetical protein
MAQEKPDSDYEYVNISTPKTIIVSSIIVAFGAGLLSLCDRRLMEHHIPLCCAFVWGLGLIALAIISKK